MNKSKLPNYSLSGVYKINCNCGKKYVGETSLKVSTRLKQRKKSNLDKKWELTGISGHAQNCHEGFKWKDVEVLNVEERKFNCKVREAL